MGKISRIAPKVNHLFFLFLFLFHNTVAQWGASALTGDLSGVCLLFESDVAWLLQFNCVFIHIYDSFLYPLYVRCT